MGLHDKVKLKESIPRAVRVVNELANPKYISQDKAIPRKLLQHCKGIAFITIYKAGLFMIGGQVGGGLVISKIDDPSAPGGFRWSAPVSVSVGGLQGGFIFGGEKISSVVILNTKSAVRGFMGKGQITFGGSLSLAAGPTGRDLSANVGVSNNKEVVPAYSYSVAKGAYIGATLDGVVLKVNESDNKSFYGRSDITGEQILSGHVDSPAACAALYDAIAECTRSATVADSGADLGAAAAPLPAGWTEHKTADGRPYYSDGRTTVWSRPTAAATASHNSFESEEKEKEKEESSGQPTIPVAQPADAGVSSTAAAASSSGATTQSGGMTRAQPPIPPSKPAPVATDAPLPAGWERSRSPDGKDFYFNRASNASQWERPEAA